MRLPMPHGLLFTIFAAFALLSSQVGADSHGEVEITEWTVPWENTRPRDPDIAPDGVIWLVGQAGHYVARFDSDTEEFERYDLPDGSGPHNVIVGSEGDLWVAGNKQAYIGQMNRETGEMKQFPMPDEAAKDPHTLVDNGQGQIWFTVQWGNFIGRLDKASGKVDLVPVPTEKARPYGIKLAADGRPWVVLLGTNKLATVDPETLELQEVEIPIDTVRPRRMGITDDGGVWYVDYETGYLGRFEPSDGTFRHWETPAGAKSGPYAMGVDAKNRIWFVQTWPDPNTLVGFDPESEEFFSITPIPSGAGTVRHMSFDPERNAFWFGTDTNNLGRAILPD